MKYTHNALTSINVQKVENITTSMTRAGLGDDTYRRQREKQRYLKCKQQQVEKQERMRDDFMKQRGQKMKQSETITQKKNLKRQKKKQLQKQRQKKMKLLKKIGEMSGSESESEEKSDENNNNNQVEKIQNIQNDDEAAKALQQAEQIIVQQNLEVQKSSQQDEVQHE